MTVMEMLAEFCSQYKSKYAVDKPFRVGEFVYATDARCAVRVPASAAPEVGEIKSPPQVGDVFPADTGGMTEYPIPPGLPKDRFPCPVCNGDGKAHFVECPACDGDGYTECDECGAEHDCKDCNGSGEIPGNGEGPCDACNGTGAETDTISLRIGPDTYLADRLLARVRRAGATTAWVRSRDTAVYFAWDGCEAVIMPWGIDNINKLADLGRPAVVRFTGLGGIEAVAKEAT